MGKNSNISWTTHTFNPVWGCLKVSPGCEHCYAETWANRYGHNVWGPAATATRRTFGEKHWNEPLRWNKDAKASGTDTTVFCGSMCDIFDNHPAWQTERPKLWALIDKTPDLIWLLLTKRPENVAQMVPEDWLVNYFPENVWLGVSVESQAYIHRVSQIATLSVNRFVSVEPMLGPVDFKDWLWAIDWVICGGESGKNCRPMHPIWAENLAEQCDLSGIPFFMKQLGGYPDKRDNPEQWQENLRIQQFPEWMDK